ncbi:MAG: LysR family transcriptional regulator, partial [Bdellovibrionales bacterium]|nr:LysR family transcriptional regulator [Bdellovibrionales bacterium]NQZ18345.1 LysR family transcriptional regulator [Bdellovibrionales bacterium]
MDNLKVSDLKLITMLARFESVRSLARHMNVEPQNLSKKIESIETSLGRKLIERSPKGIQLTSDGSRIVDKTQKVLFELSDLETGFTENSTYKESLDIVSRGFIINFLCPHLV